MLITKESQMSRIEHTRNIPVNPKKYDEWVNSPPQTRTHVQYAFPDLSTDDREFLITGITPDEWEKMFGGEE